MTEQRLQQEIYMYFHNTYPHLRGLFFRVKNEGASRISGAIGKATGVVPGVSDMILLLPSGRCIFIELKTETGKQSATQANWQRTVEDAGFEYYIVRSLDRFKMLCEEKIRRF